MQPSALGSLLFDFEVVSEDRSTHGSSAAQVPEVELIAHRLELLTRTTVPFAREIRSCVHRRQAVARGDDVHTLGRYLVSEGYEVSVRSALPGQGSDCFKALRHEFLVVKGAGEYAGMEFLMEPALRQHFAIPHPSRDYALLLSRVPDIFVGGSCRLAPLVQLLCALMADSFAQQGLALPPWRKEAAMLSKWLPLPNRTRDTPIAPASPRPFSSFSAPAVEGTGDGGGPPVDRDVPVLDFGRTDSSTSNVTASDCGGVCSMGCSPVAEVLPQPQPSWLSYTTAAAAGAGGGGGRKFWAVHGFAPLMTPQSPPLPPPAAAACADSAATAATVFDGGSVGGKSPGLLAAKLQRRRDAGGGGGGGGGEELIRTRAPAHPGEMAIRVVKLVGFALPPAQARQQQPQPPPAEAPPAEAAAAEAAESQRRRMLPWRRNSALQARAA